MKDFHLINQPLDRAEIKHVDSTPNCLYPVRILQAYYQDAKTRVSDNTEGLPNKNIVFDIMNKDQEKREMVLKKAISILHKHMNELDII